MTRQTSINQFSYMRIFACFGIVILHELFASTIYFEASMSTGDRVFEGVLEHMLMWCVPIFLMVTGALLLNPEREITMKKLFAKYIARMAVALVAFTFIFQCIDKLTGDSNENIFTGFIKDLVYGTSWAHMWYIYLMIALYLMLPLFQGITKAADKWIKYFIIVALIFVSIIPMLQIFGVENVALSIPLSTIYPVYLFIGYYLYKHKMSMAMGWLLTIGCSAVIIAVTVLTITKGSSEMSTLAYENIAAYSSIFVVGQTAGIFTLMDRIKWSLDSFLANLDKCTFGIYIIHMIGVRYILKTLEIDPYKYGLWIFPGLAIVLFFLSFALTFGFRYITGKRA